jgi:hypothetical protein
MFIPLGRASTTRATDVGLNLVVCRIDPNNILARDVDLLRDVADLECDLERVALPS